MALRPNLHPLLGFAPPMHPLFRQGVQGDNDCMKCNVTGKAIVPFCTSGGNGIGFVGDRIKALLGGKATVVNGQRMGGDTSPEDLKIWADGLDL